MVWERPFYAHGAGPGEPKARGMECAWLNFEPPTARLF